MNRVMVISDEAVPSGAMRRAIDALRARGTSVEVVSDVEASMHGEKRPLVKLVERRDGDRTEMLTAAQAARYDLMTTAVTALLEARVEQPDTKWVPEMAPLTKRERRGVLADAYRKAAELEA